MTGNLFISCYGSGLGSLDVERAFVTSLDASVHVVREVFHLPDSGQGDALFLILKF